MTNEININDAFESIKQTAQIILDNPDSINKKNYKDVFDILEKGAPEVFTKTFKENILKKLGVKE